MSGRVVVTGLTSLQQFFATADRNLRAAAMDVVKATTEGAATDIRRAYPRGPTGNLQSRVRTTYPASTVVAGVVLSTAPHSHIYEFSNKERVTTGKKSVRAGVSRGVMNSHKGWPPKTTPTIAARRRLEMERKLIEVLRAAGFEIDDAR